MTAVARPDVPRLVAEPVARRADAGAPPDGQPPGAQRLVEPGCGILSCVSHAAITPGERYAALVEALLGHPAVTLSTKRGFGEGTLQVGGSIFAMLSHDRLVVKLPRARVDSLIASGDGERFDPGHGRLMKEWLSLSPDSTLDWPALAREGLTFVASRPVGRRAR